MKEQVDVIIQNVEVYNSYFKKFQRANVSILNEKIYYIDRKQQEEFSASEVVDGTGTYMIPGLIDIHMHIESSMMVPKVFCNHLASCGVTTIVSEPHEIANVNGIRGILDMIDAGDTCPIDIFYGIPSCVPSSNEFLETTGGKIDCHDMKLLMENERVICVGEVMNYREIIKENNLEIGKFLNYIHEIDSNIVIEGHCPSLVDLDLAKFLYLGINGDHTEHNLEELEQRFENGMFVEIQEKMLSKEILDFIEENQLYEHFGFVTDDVMADTFYEDGQLDLIVRKAISLGMKPEQAIYNATFTNARRMNLLDRGVLAPGKKADFFLTKNLETLEILETYKDGSCIFRKDEEEKEMETSREERGFDESYYQSIRLNPVSLDVFSVPFASEEEVVTVRAIEVCDGSTKTKEKKIQLPVKQGMVKWEDSPCRLAMVMERYGKTDSIGYGFVCGDSIKTGAVATSYAHDSHNLLVVGATAMEMQKAVNEVISMQGGIVTVNENKVTASLALPVGGILSEEPIKEISKNLKGVRKELIKQGYCHYNPIMSLCTLTLPVSPILKLTDKGLVNVKEGNVVSLFV